MQLLQSIDIWKKKKRNKKNKNKIKNYKLQTKVKTTVTNTNVNYVDKHFRKAWGRLQPQLHAYMGYMGYKHSYMDYNLKLFIKNI